MIPRTPLEWDGFSPELLETISDTRHPVLISLNDLTLTKQIDLQYYLEYNIDHSPNTEFRKFVHRHNIELLSFEFSWNEPMNEEGVGEESAYAIDEILHEQYPEIEENIMLTPEFVLALPGMERLIFFREQFPESNDIMAAVLSDGAVLQGETYFPDRYR